MCDCHARPDEQIELLDVESGFDFVGAARFPAWFETPEWLGTSTGPVRVCPDCGQAWYVETAPEEGDPIAFAVKVPGTSAPSPRAVSTAKQFLMVLAHDGFSPDACVFEACDANALKGRMLCPRHFVGGST